MQIEKPCKNRVNDRKVKKVIGKTETLLDELQFTF
uniref:Uncharacterized protein n=1 Tax=Arundo donax TaxID=35708 RepID=A0A0A9BSJ8_ARUDO